MTYDAQEGCERGQTCLISLKFNPRIGNKVNKFAWLSDIEIGSTGIFLSDLENSVARNMSVGAERAKQHVAQFSIFQMDLLIYFVENDQCEHRAQPQSCG